MNGCLDNQLSVFLKEAREEIGKGNVTNVIEKMRYFFQNSPQINEIIHQQSRLSKLAIQIRLGTISLEDKIVSENQVVLAILELIDELSRKEYNQNYLQEEIISAINISNSKNLVVDSNIFAENVHIGDNYFQKLYALNELKHSLLIQQSNIFKQNMISEVDELYIQLPKQKRIKETLPFNQLIQQTSKDVSELSIENVFHKECYDSMLILGEPGAGKSTLLMELGFRIATETLKENKGLVPIFLNLTSWGIYQINKDSKAVFWDWLKYEFKAVYGVSGKEYEEILISKQVVFLLDGLDEVIESERKSCLLALNEFISEYRIPVAITCRRIEYDLLKQQFLEKNECNILRLNGAIEIMPIVKRQMEEYLQQKSYDEILISYNRSETLQSVLNSPLWLSIAVNAHKNNDWQIFKEEPQDWKYELMAYYEGWVINEKLPKENNKNKTIAHNHSSNRSLEYSEEDVTLWMGWLAFMMNRENLSVFYLERLQPWSLPNRYIAKYKFRADLTTTLFVGITFGLVSAYPYGISFGLAYCCGHVLGRMFSIYNGKVFLEILPKRLAVYCSAILSYGISYGLSFCFTGVISFGFFTKVMIYYFSFGLFIGLGVGIMYSFLGVQNNISNIIPIVNVVEYFKFNVIRGGLFFIVGLMISFIFSLSLVLLIGWELAFVLALACSLAFGMTFCLETNILKETLEPNQGIVKTKKYLMWSFLPSIVILISSIMIKFLNLLVISHSTIVFISLLGGILFFVIPAKMGLNSYVRHFLIRGFLEKENFIPKKYVPFLNSACRLGYLRRVGGGYRFFHREFHNYLLKKNNSKFVSFYKSLESIMHLFGK